MDDLGNKLSLLGDFQIHNGTSAWKFLTFLCYRDVEARFEFPSESEMQSTSNRNLSYISFVNSRVEPGLQTRLGQDLLSPSKYEINNAKDQTTTHPWFNVFSTDNEVRINLVLSSFADRETGPLG